MNQRILLGTADDIASAFRTSIAENTDQLEVIKQNVPLFHNLEQVIKHTHPDILYLMFNQMRFDAIGKQDIHNEILQTLYNIRSENGQLRIAVQVADPVDQNFLRQLILLNVYDIFEPTGSTGQLNIRLVIDQLTRPANINGVKKYIISPDIDQSFRTPDALPVKGNANGLPDSQNDSALINANRFLTQELTRLKKKTAVPLIPRSDYDQLLARLREAVNSGMSDENVKELVQSVTANNNRLAQENQMLNQRLNESSATISQLSRQLSSRSKTDEDMAQLQVLQRDPSKKNEPIRRTDRGGQRQKKDPNAIRKKHSRRSSSKDKKPRAKKPRKKAHSKGRRFLLLIILILIVGSVWMGIGHLRSQGNKTVEKQPSYSTLVSKDEYGKAAEAYPEKGISIENRMLNDPSVKDKASQAAKIAEYISGDAINFDNAYFNSDFNKAVKIYEQSDDTDLTHLNKARRTMLAYSYMKIGNVDNARKLAEPLNNAQLNQKIDAYAKFQDANKTLQDKINSGTLSDEDKAKAQKQIQKNQNAMDKL
ncbi:hypothetical protein ACLUWZ_09230 [Limosilactobacillus mucosae]|uniref:hypothetical protein n=1 Tax=Limosilactobacillus mucosae TaxID=97478 RepID=UPI0039933329